MDAAEAWLRENDPEYARTSEAWKHVTTGEYVPPAQEIPVGDARDIERLVERGDGKYVGPVEWRTCDRRRCGMEFVPKTPWQRYCSEFCQRAESERRRRERKRAA